MTSSVGARAASLAVLAALIALVSAGDTRFWHLTRGRMTRGFPNRPAAAGQMTCPPDGTWLDTIGAIISTP